MNSRVNSVFKTTGNMVMVFDSAGEQIPEYQGDYAYVKDSIRRDAPPNAVFAHWHHHAIHPVIIPRKNW
ncbi:hypothetical protein ACFLXH_05260 [Chloroflexota bacterium]